MKVRVPAPSHNRTPAMARKTQKLKDFYARITRVLVNSAAFADALEAVTAKAHKR
jgi:hypothetical protein